MLESQTVVVKKKDVHVLTPQILSISKPYVPIYQWCYGRMDESTPWSGLGTAGVVSCTVVIFHCTETKRTILSHSPNFLQMNTFVPMLDWCAGGTGNQHTISERLAWRYGGSAPSSAPVTIEAVVLRGKDYATPRAQRYGHEGWMKDLRELCSDAQRSQAHTINVTDHSRILQSAAVLVEKGSGKITFFSLDSSLRGAVIAGIDNSLASDYSVAVQKRDLFVGSFIYAQRETFDINLQWDVSRNLRGIPLPIEARELIRSAKIGQPASVRSELLRRIGQPDWISMENQSPEVLHRNFLASGPESLASHEVLILKQGFSELIRIGMPCEGCPKVGGMTCTACKGAWYCGPEHQKEDWKAHKGWCKAHKVK